MTCIYDAWSEALKVGHNQIGLKKEPIFHAYSDVNNKFTKKERPEYDALP